VQRYARGDAEFLRAGRGNEQRAGHAFRQAAGGDHRSQAAEAVRDQPDRRPSASRWLRHLRSPQIDIGLRPVRLFDAIRAEQRSIQLCQ
jgi:hypothetical protein